MCARGRTEGLTLDGVECSALGLREPGEVHWAEMNERAAPVVVQAERRNGPPSSALARFTPGAAGSLKAIAVPRISEG